MSARSDNGRFAFTNLAVADAKLRIPQLGHGHVPGRLGADNKHMRGIYSNHGEQLLVLGRVQAWGGGSG